ncbi:MULTISPECIES: hypothetical protein [unclassified Paraburkholderia]|nr:MULTISPECIES: hypothetical protein [unclassified Paraburkholderia]MBB5441649.1 hypothetical protein [Paraburkholderia sp. WSM4177]MBB5482044.1 hypothetical protein [Paraburkholderia sp. WSM4180]
MSSLRSHLLPVAGTGIAFAFALSLWINHEVFTHIEFVRGVD